jgi:hypothetical protein
MNYPQQSAQGLASLGRGNDSMLVHMTPNEVQGLQGLAMAHGGSLTVNPQTGLPEAGFLDFVLPVAGSFFGIPPWATAAMMAGKTLIEGGDIGSAALSAFGGYTGGKFGQSLKSFVDPIQSLPTSAVNAANTAQALTGGGAGNVGAFNTFADKISPAASGVTKTATSLTNQISPFTNNSLGTNLGVQNVNPTVGVNTGGYDVAGQTADSLKSSFAPTDIGSTIKEGASDFGNQFSTAVKNPIDFARHVGEGDALAGGAKLGMYAASPFVEDMMKPPQFSFTDPDKGKYRGPQGQLNLSDQFDTGLRLAAGGAVGNPSVGGGLSDLYNRPEGQGLDNISSGGYGLGRLSQLGTEQAMNQAKTLGYADGGDVSNYRQDQVALNLNLAGKPSENSKDGNPVNAVSNLLGGLYSPTMGITPFNGMPGGVNGMGMPMMGLLGLLGRGAPLTPKSYALNLNSGKQEAQYAQGGYLNGAGDGMSDSIPATIEGKQPARLADGEFVVPADVVSHLGNGSSKAGSKRLYKMLDKVRHARTGNKKQGKQIKADKYLPA